MPRFVILEHDHPMLHWDFMLESGAALRTWRLALPPAHDIAIAATPLGDHRMAYLEYEGPLSGKRGSVRQFDGGTFEVLEQSTERFVVRFCGHRLNGTATLRRVGEKWSCVFTLSGTR